MKQNEKEIKIKCASCGASLNLTDKKCEYCGSMNPNYKQKEIKDIKMPQKVVKNKGIFGELFGNVFEDILDNFDED